MSVLQLCGVIIVVLTILLIGFCSGRYIKNPEDFESAGGNGGIGLVSGMTLGTMIGGSSTIGTAQLAYSQGISAWWFTLSCGLTCLLLALLYTKPFRRAKASTLLGILRLEYGSKTELAAAILMCIVLFALIVPQLIAASAVLPVIFPGITIPASVALAAGLMLVYIVFGGALGAGEIGKIKIILLYVTVLFGAYIVLKGHGLQALWNTLDHHMYFDLFANGAGKETSKALSVVLGNITGQVYMQAIRAAKSEKTAYQGELISALLVPPVGLASVLIGMYMRVNHPDLANAKDAFPRFVLLYMPELLSGIVMGTLLLAIIGAGAGTLLALSTVINRNIMAPRTHRFYAPDAALKFIRLCIVLSLFGACLLSTGILGDSMLAFSSIGTGLCAATIFPALTCSILFPQKVSQRWAFTSIFVGTAFSLLFSFWTALPVDGMGMGVLGSSSCCICGFFAKKKSQTHLSQK